MLALDKFNVFWNTEYQTIEKNITRKGIINSIYTTMFLWLHFSIAVIYWIQMARNYVARYERVIKRFNFGNSITRNEEKNNYHHSNVYKRDNSDKKNGRMAK